MDPLKKLTKEEANKRIAELLAQNKANLKECELIAVNSGVTFYGSDDDRYATFIPNLEMLKSVHYWEQSDNETDEAALARFTSEYGISIPGWVSSSTFC